MNYTSMFIEVQPPRLVGDCIEHSLAFRLEKHGSFVLIRNSYEKTKS